MNELDELWRMVDETEAHEIVTRHRERQYRARATSSAVAAAMNNPGKVIHVQGDKRKIAASYAIVRDAGLRLHAKRDDGDGTYIWVDKV